MTAPPEVPAGTLLQLAAADWTDGPDDLTPGAQVAVVVSAVRLAPASAGWTWVVGHRPQCGYATADEHLPCLELRVRTTALAGGRP